MVKWCWHGKPKTSKYTCASADLPTENLTRNTVRFGSGIQNTDRHSKSTRRLKYDRDDVCVNKSQFVPVIFEPPCIRHTRCCKESESKSDCLKVYYPESSELCLCVVPTDPLAPKEFKQGKTRLGHFNGPKSVVIAAASKNSDFVRQRHTSCFDILMKNIYQRSRSGGRTPILTWSRVNCYI